MNLDEALAVYFSLHNDTGKGQNPAWCEATRVVHQEARKAIERYKVPAARLSPRDVPEGFLD